MLFNCLDLNQTNTKRRISNTNIKMYVVFIKHLDMETEMGCLTKNEQFSLWKSGGKIRAFPKRGIVPD